LGKKKKRGKSREKRVRSINGTVKKESCGGAEKKNGQNRTELPQPAPQATS